MKSKNILQFIELRKELDKQGGEVELEKIALNFNYSEYMHSFLWIAISNFCREVQSECVKCGSIIKLAVHHLDYSFFGIDIYHLDKLTVLCDKCHTLIHQLKDAAKKNKKFELPKEWIELDNIQSIMRKKGINVHEMV